MRKSKASVTLFTAVWTSYKVSFSLPQRLLQVQAHTSNLRLYVKYCRSALSKYFCDAVLFYGAEQYLTIVDYTGIIYRNTWCHWLENVCVCVCFCFVFSKLKQVLTLISGFQKSTVIFSNSKPKLSFIALYYSVLTTSHV